VYGEEVDVGLWASPNVETWDPQRLPAMSLDWQQGLTVTTRRLIAAEPDHANQRSRLHLSVDGLDWTRIRPRLASSAIAVADGRRASWPSTSWARLRRCGG
jgi:hypothetical protein